MNQLIFFSPKENQLHLDKWLEYICLRNWAFVIGYWSLTFMQLMFYEQIDIHTDLKL